jgi:hypothetical protein
MNISSCQPPVGRKLSKINALPLAVFILQPSRPMNAKVFCFVTLSLVSGNLCRASENQANAATSEQAVPAVPAALIPGLETPVSNIEKPNGHPTPVQIPDDARAEIKAREAIWRKQRPRWIALLKNFHNLQRKRAAMLVASDKIRDRHIKALRRLYDQAVALGEEGKKVGTGDMDRHISINTELHIFGAGAPGVFYWIVNDDQRVASKTLVDPRTHITYKLNSDGRHVKAIAPNGKILWAHDAFNDYGLEPYRVTKPVIVVFKLSASSQEEYDTARERESHEAITTTDARAIGFAERQDYSKRFIEITFNSSQFGDIDAASGKFTFGGQN